MPWSCIAKSNQARDIGMLSKAKLESMSQLRPRPAKPHTNKMGPLVEGLKRVQAIRNLQNPMKARLISG